MADWAFSDDGLLPDPVLHPVRFRDKIVIKAAELISFLVSLLQDF